MFSVVIPLYNKAHTIINTLQSALNQSFMDFEVVIVDDGSTDNGVEVIKQFTNDERVRIIRQENKGVSAARNNGIKHARYDYIALLDGDDEWEMSFLAQMKGAIEKFPDAGFYGASSWHRDISTGEQSCHILPKYKGKISKVEYLGDVFSLTHTSTMVLSRKHFLQIDSNGEGFPVGMKVCEDWACFYRLSFIAEFVFVGFPLGIRNLNVEGQVTGLSEDERFALMIHVVDFYNISFRGWTTSKLKKPIYPRFLKYDLRARIIYSLRMKDYRTLKYLLAGLDDDIISRFSKLELSLYKNEKLNLVSKLYILFTKIVWKTGKLIN
jgi:glycosyltransferase involved in cell wall biosynthesis